VIESLLAADAEAADSKAIVTLSSHALRLFAGLTVRDRGAFQNALRELQEIESGGEHPALPKSSFLVRPVNEHLRLIFTEQPLTFTDSAQGHLYHVLGIAILGSALWQLTEMAQ
jgi:hypothetical protein